MGLKNLLCTGVSLSLHGASNSTGNSFQDNRLDFNNSNTINIQYTTPIVLLWPTKKASVLLIFILKNLRAEVVWQLEEEQSIKQRARFLSAAL